MKTEKNILVAFILNLAFSIFEFFGGIFTGSVAIISDAIHDLGDAISIGLSFFLEKKSKRQPDETHTYGYARYSVVGGAITTLILVLGSFAVVYNAVLRIIHPVEIHYDGMLVFAVVGVCVNLCAALFTREGDSINQKAVNLHMLEDVFGWLVVLIGAIVIKFTNFYILDPLLSIGVALFILVNAAKNLKEAIDLFLEKTPDGICVEALKAHICAIDGVLDAHHIHIWSIDGQSHYATMHIVAAGNPQEIKRKIREELKEHGVGHVTLDLEEEGEACLDTHCRIDLDNAPKRHSHHHHH